MNNILYFPLQKDRIFSNFCLNKIFQSQIIQLHIFTTFCRGAKLRAFMPYQYFTAEKSHKKFHARMHASQCSLTPEIINH